MADLAHINKLADTYRPNQTVHRSLSEKSLVMFVGPVATGKTFIMKQIARLDNRFGLVTSFTTREQRNDDDPEMFRYIPHLETQLSLLAEKIKKGELVQYAVHPTSHRIYGSEPQDYSATYNMLATLSGVVGLMNTLPFKNIFIIGLVCKPEVWQKWLNKRYPKPSNERQKRIKEAIQSLEWLLSTKLPVIWIENIPDTAEQTARDTLDVILYNKTSNHREIAEAMLERAKELV